MKKIFSLLVLSVSILVLTACQTKKENEIHFGVSFYPAPEIAELIADDLKAQGYTLVIRPFTSYAAANPALKNNEIDANFIQHQYYLNNYNKQDNADIVIAQNMYHSKFSLYSEVYDSVESIPDGSEIILPNDDVNTARSFLLLQKLGLITINNGKTFDAKVSDISNPRGFVFKYSGLTATQDSFDEQGRKLAVMYPTYTKKLQNFDSVAATIGEEDYTDLMVQSYAISVAVRRNDLESPKIKALLEALRSDKVRDWINTNYGWAAIPAF